MVPSWKTGFAAGSALALLLGAYQGFHRNAILTPQEASLAPQIVQVGEEDFTKDWQERAGTLSVQGSQEDYEIYQRTQQHLKRSQDQNLRALFGNDFSLEVRVEQEKAKWLGTSGRFPLLDKRRKAKMAQKREFLEELLQRLTAFDDYFNTAESLTVSKGSPSNRFVHYGLIAAESLAYIKAQNNASDAKGLCQFMDRTAQSMGVFVSSHINRSFSPASIESCIWFLEQEIPLILSGVSKPLDYRHKLAAYNAGPSQVRYALKRGNYSFSDLSSFFSSPRFIPGFSRKFSPQKETQEYLVRVFSFAEIFKLAALPVSEKKELAKRLEKNISSAEGLEKLHIINNLAALNIRWPQTPPQWSVHIDNYSNCSYGGRVPSYLKVFNPHLPGDRTYPPSVCIHKPDSSDPSVRYLQFLFAKNE
ncbi:lytic transglycosylase domain-containing protein [Candidatus Woesearchaeota archaeon]|nr:MAG: lytic transglycosylase domain-containing protein [Candidatus Woesearchaeota archaeon]